MTRDEAKQILNIPTAEFTTEDLKKQYHKLARKCHPDLGGNPQDMMKLTEAYEFLSDPKNLLRMTITHSGILDVVMC